MTPSQTSIICMICGITPSDVTELLLNPSTAKLRSALQHLLNSKWSDLSRIRHSLTSLVFRSTKLFQNNPDSTGLVTNLQPSTCVSGSPSAANNVDATRWLDTCSVMLRKRRLRLYGDVEFVCQKPAGVHDLFHGCPERADGAVDDEVWDAGVQGAGSRSQQG